MQYVFKIQKMFKSRSHSFQIWEEYQNFWLKAISVFFNIQANGCLKMSCILQTSQKVYFTLIDLKEYIKTVEDKINNLNIVIELSSRQKTWWTFTRTLVFSLICPSLYFTDRPSFSFIYWKHKNINCVIWGESWIHSFFFTNPCHWIK